MKNVVNGEVIGVGCFIISILVSVIAGKWCEKDESILQFDRKGYDQLVGDTPLVELKAISSLLKRKILVKVSYYCHC